MTALTRDGETGSAPRDSGAPDLVPARMLNEYTYCPRLFYLEWVQGEFEDSEDTIQGRWRHRRVNRESGGEDTDPVEHCPEEPVHARSLMLSGEGEGLIARIDLVEIDGQKATPVDYKRGAVPKTTDRAWEPERVQLCAQALILRENGYECDEGVLYYVESRSRVTIPMDETLICQTRELLSNLRTTAESGTIPPPLVDSPKCPRCSLVGICLPDEVNALRASGNRGVVTPLRRLIPESEDALPVYVQEQGAFVGKWGDVLVVKKDQQKLQEIRLLDTSQLCLIGNVQVSTQAVRDLTAQGIPVIYFTYGGWFSAMTQGALHKNVELRIRQYRVAGEPDAQLRIARALVAGKIHNCRTLLRRNHKGQPGSALGELNRLRARAKRAASVETLLGLEGAAAKVYFSNFAGMLKGDLVEGWDFHGRNRRPPRDPVNALLSFLYALLIKDAMVAVTAVGFDPYLGFYHAPKYGKPALALDLVEEFRPLIADSTVLSLINGMEIQARDFIRRAGAVALTETGRKKLLKAYERRMDQVVTHPIFGYSVSYRRIIIVQARLLARTISGEIPAYPAFATR
ncbi:MAG TPA: CRISPR-associated endonuclease Cas1 [Bacillota bacterium]|nr:CRISPR-associated endonuclease Cas1 [Bacillota bacterium]